MVKDYINTGSIEILAHINDDNETSGFQATLIQKTDESGNVVKVLAIAGTNPLSSDLTADAFLTEGAVPPGQFESMTQFFDDQILNGNIASGDNLIVTGHSLGGAITQLCAVTYGDFVDEAYTFNSPGAADLVSLDDHPKYVALINPTGWDAETQFHYQDFLANKEDPNVQDSIKNITAVEGISPIANLGTDIGEEFFIIGKSHLLGDMIVNMENLQNLGITSQEDITDYIAEIELVEYYHLQYHLKRL